MTSRDATFTSFTPEQAAAYASARGTSYPQPLYDRILEYHNGARDIVFDVGTGPGKVVFDLLPYFESGLGCDTGEEMIEQAEKDALRLGVSDRTDFEVSGGETCGDAFPGKQVDLLTVAMAAHWFDLEKFYASAAKVLRPGGTLAIWTCSSTYVHPSIPNHEKIQEILFELEDNMLGPYQTPGNLLSRNAYDDLALPWTIEGVKDMFNEASFERHDWDRNGIPSALPLADGSPGPFLFGDRGDTIQSFVDAVGSASMVIRWREANSEKAHTDDDPVNMTARKLREVSGGKEKLWLSPSLSLLLMRRV